MIPSRLQPVLAGILLLCSGPVFGQPPGLISFQGQVAVRGEPFNGLGQFKFALVDGGTLVTRPPAEPLTLYETYWSHDGTSRAGGSPESSVPIAVTDGLYSVMLGDKSVRNMLEPIPVSVFTNPAVYLRVWFDDGRNGFEQLLPDQRVGSVGYALVAAGTGPGAVTTAMLADGAVTGAKIEPGSVDASRLDDGGRGVYAGLVEALQPLSQHQTLPFEALSVVATNGAPPGLAFTLGEASFGTVEGFTGREGLSEPYEYVVEVTASGIPLVPETQIGRPARLTFTRNGRSTAFAGLVTGCSASAAPANTQRYIFRLEPPLAYLRLTTGYRILQDRTVPEVVAQVHGELAGEGVDELLTASYPIRNCVVQYRETAFDFISRLMEEEGIFYFFNPSSSLPGPVLGDAVSAYLSGGTVSIPHFNPAAGAPPPAPEFIRIFQNAARESTRTSTVATRDFTRPALALLESVSSSRGRGELFEYGTLRTSVADLQSLARIRQQRHEVERRTFFGAGNAADLRAGQTFTLDDRTGSGVGGEYVVTTIRHAGFRRVSQGASVLLYGNEFEAIPATLVFRPARRTPKPVAQSSTAVVTGPPGEEIFTDEYGRVKVRFPWIHDGASDENSSCWIRVSTPVAGRDRGFLFLPRVGDEVLVDFEQGDVNRPIIVGSLWNGADTPPQSLPADKYVSTIRTRSQGGGANEIRMDDTPGAESMALSARNLLLQTSGQQIRLDDGPAMVLTADRIAFDTPAVSIDGRDYTRDNAIVAWAKVNATGTLSGNSFGVAGVTNPREGVYEVTLSQALESASVVVPVATAEMKGQPVIAEAVRFTSVDQVLNNRFNVYINSGLGIPINHAFTVIVTGR